MNHEILPYEGTTALKLGMTSQEIQEVVGSEPGSRFKKAGVTDTDMFNDFFAYYNECGACVGLEFFHPAKVFFKHQDLLDIPFEEAKALFEELDNNIEYDGAGLTSYKYGIGIYAPFADENPEEKPEGILVFK